MVARLARDPNQFLSTIQVGITLAGFLAAAAAAVRWPSHFGLCSGS
jgi:putative hemolysin